MKHAGQAALNELEDLLVLLRALPELKEKSRGAFYWKSKAFLHFHEDPKGLFADIRAMDGVAFDRFDITAPADRRALAAEAAARLKA